MRLRTWNISFLRKSRLRACVYLAYVYIVHKEELLQSIWKIPVQHLKEMKKKDILEGREAFETECVRMNNTKGNLNLPLITTILVAMNVAVFFITDIFFFERVEEVSFYMALNPGFVIKRGEYWRLFTSLFYHFGIEHLLSNMLMLYFMGMMLEPFLGHFRFFILYFVAGLLADAASILYNSLIVSENMWVVFSAGASGAVYGLLGALCAVFLFIRERVPAELKRRLPIAVLFLLFGSIFDTGVGHAAHFGGFLAGALLGALYCACRKRKQDGQGRRKSSYGGDK